MTQVLPPSSIAGSSGPPLERTGETVRVLLVEWYGVLRDALAAWLGQQDRLQVVACVSSIDDAISALSQTPTDVILMDAPRVGDMESLKGLVAAAPSTRIVVLSDPSSAEEVGRALRAGAQGFVSKKGASDLLAKGIHLVHEGSRFMCPIILDLYLRSTTGQSEAVAPPRHSQLTPREREVLELISQGRTDRQIGGLLSLSIKTVHTYRTRIMEKLDVHSVGLLVRRAFQLGILAP